MLNPFICGTGAFHHQEEDDHDELPWSSPNSTPRKSRRNSFCKRRDNKDSKNPYSTRGLDKFAALLADLEERRQKIYSQMGSQDISLVRFVYKNSNDCVPIVVKLKEKKQEKTNTGSCEIKDKPITQNSSEVLDKCPIECSAAETEVKESKVESNKKSMKNSFSRYMRLSRWRRPSYYLPVAIILVLLFLAVFGRSVAILCTCVGWYIIPTLKGGKSNVRKSIKKKEYVRRLSEDKMVSDGLSSPKINNSGTVKDKSPRQHGHRKSW